MLLKRKSKNSVKNLSAALQAVNDPLENQLGYMNSNRPSKPNLPDAPKPSKLLVPTRLRRTVSSPAFWILQLAYCINQYELVLSWTASQTSRTFSLLWIGWGKDFVYTPLMGMTMERVRVKEFWRIKCIRLWMNQSCFSLRFLCQNSLLKLSTFRGYKGIYSRVWDEMWKVSFQQNRVH